MIETTLLGRADEVIEYRSCLLRCMSPLLVQNGHLTGPIDIRFWGKTGLAA